MRIFVRATASYELASESFVQLMVEPAREAPDHLLETDKLITSPTPYSVLGKDHAGNLQRRMVAPAGEFTYDYSARIVAEPNVAVPLDAVEHRPQDLPGGDPGLPAPLPLHRVRPVPPDGPGGIWRGSAGRTPRPGGLRLGPLAHGIPGRLDG